MKKDSFARRRALSLFNIYLRLIRRRVRRPWPEEEHSITYLMLGDPANTMATALYADYEFVQTIISRCAKAKGASNERREI